MSTNFPKSEPKFPLAICLCNEEVLHDDKMFVDNFSDHCHVSLTSLLVVDYGFRIIQSDHAPGTFLDVLGRLPRFVYELFGNVFEGRDVFSHVVSFRVVSLEECDWIVYPKVPGT